MSKSRTESPRGLSFGSACIDQLIDPTQLIYAAGDRDPVVACIIGPDGVGKSILSLTAASTYAASSPSDRRVIYASTDLNFHQAKSTWEHFGLDDPKRRRELLRKNLESLYIRAESLEALEENDEHLTSPCELIWLSPSKDAEASEGQQPFMALFQDDKSKSKSKVFFLDLAAYSAGDDWGLINQAVGLLPCMFGKQANGGKKPAPHLLIVDAVEGLEAMAGRFDRFGLSRSRRSRLAQLVRLTRKANCHVIFVVEQKSQEERPDEVFVSDLVLRLRAEKNDAYLQKTIEIEKARSVSHIRGAHELQIRDGRGGGNPEGTAPDDPPLSISDNRWLAYLQVIPSLHQKYRPDGAQ